MNGAFDEKNELRIICARRRDAFTGSDRAAAEEKIRLYLSAMASYRHAAILLFYMPIKSEVDILPLIREALDKGRKVALPRCENGRGEMTFRYISALDELQKGRFGVLEPSENAKTVSVDELKRQDLFALVPALAFDKEGYRLGYGKGYYDRFLNVFAGVSVGVIFDELIFERLPKGYFDRRVTALVSERGVKMTRA